MCIRIFIPILLLLFFNSCKQNSQHTVSKTGDSKLYIQKIANYEDSFDIYSDSLGAKITHGDTIFSIQKLNNKKYAFVNIKDSLQFVYYYEKRKWIKKKSIALEDTFFDAKVEDLNADGYKDFILYGFPNMHGNCIPYVFLSDSNFELIYRPDLSLYNIEYDSSTKLIRSHYIGGVLSTNYKEYYKWNNDSLSLVKGVKRQYMNDSTFITSFYGLKDQKEVIYKEVKDNSSDVFDKTFWELEYYLTPSSQTPISMP